MQKLFLSVFVRPCRSCDRCLKRADMSRPKSSTLQNRFNRACRPIEAIRRRRIAASSVAAAGDQQRRGADRRAGIERRAAVRVEHCAAGLAQDQIGRGEVPVMRVGLDEGRVERRRRRPWPAGRRARECRARAGLAACQSAGIASISGFGPPISTRRAGAAHRRCGWPFLQAPPPGQRPEGLVASPGIRARRRAGARPRRRRR